jgi:hypothetical protein
MIKRDKILLLAGLWIGGVLPSRADISEETRARVSENQAAVRLLLVPEVLVTVDGDYPVPDDVFKITLELILEQHAGRRPSVDSVYGERFRALYRIEQRSGLSPALRRAWTELFWAWREELDR